MDMGKEWGQKKVVAMLNGEGHKNFCSSFNT